MGEPQHSSMSSWDLDPQKNHPFLGIPHDYGNPHMISSTCRSVHNMFLSLRIPRSGVIWILKLELAAVSCGKWTRWVECTFLHSDTYGSRCRVQNVALLCLFLVLLAMLRVHVSFPSGSGETLVLSELSKVKVWELKILAQKTSDGLLLTWWTLCKPQGFKTDSA